MRIMMYRIDDVYSDLKAGEKTVLQYWKDFIIEWRRHNFTIPFVTTLSVTNVNTLWLWFLFALSLKTNSCIVYQETFMNKA